MPFPSLDQRRLAGRIAAAIIGGYALCWALFFLLCAWLPYSRASVWYLTGQLTPLPFLAVLLHSFVVRDLRRVLAWPLALAALLAVLGSLA